MEYALLLVAFLLSAAAASAQVLVPTGSTWRYLDDGSDAGTTWRSSSFDDSSWSFGPAQLGYGDGDEATVVGFGPSSSNKFRTTYFRHEFNVADPSVYQTMRLNLQRDDGAIVYLNETEIVRSNMPSGAVNYLSFAASTVGGEAEDLHYPQFLPIDSLQPGQNILAVEIHQRAADSSDISFDLELLGISGTVLTRGPYLNLGTENSVVVRWRTNLPTDSRVRFGSQPGSLTSVVSDPALSLDHEVTVSGLNPDTTYSYAVGTSTTDLAGDDADHQFTTHPPIGSIQPVRIWAIGDSGTANSDVRTVRDAYSNFAGSTPTDVWLMLGDNAYVTGTDAEYQVAVFDTFSEMLRDTILWPARGNHETSSSVFYGAFSLPAAGEAGGAASGTERYFSFDYANVHFVCSDSEGSDRSVGGAMHTWLQMDLAQTNQRWIIAFWHHPPYTKGSHDSDDEGDLIDMRENFLPLLEAGGVDLVLCGHSHAYERSYLIDGHYDTSDTLLPSMILDDGDGDATGDGAYHKVGAGNSGAVYAVAGSSGKISGGDLDHPAMFISLNVLGSVSIDVDGDALDVRFIDETGTVRDRFTLGKTGDSFCFGDGGDGAGCTDCPCGNNASAGERTGCINSSSVGATLLPSGLPRVGQDLLRFEVSGEPPMTFGILLSADNQLPNVGPCVPGSGILSSALDGLRCVGGAALRHGTRATASDGSIGSTTNGWGPPSGPPEGLIANGGFQSGVTRHYQVFYREDVALQCQSAQNSTNAVSIIFAP